MSLGVDDGGRQSRQPSKSTEPPDLFPMVPQQQGGTSNSRCISSQKASSRFWGRNDTKRPGFPGASESRARVSARDFASSLQEQSQRDVVDAPHGVPTKPISILSARGTPRRPREMPMSGGSQRAKNSGIGASPLRTISRLLGFGGGRGTSDEISLKPYQNISKMLNYRPRGHGRAFEESYDLGEVLGTGGFAAVREATYKPDGEQCAAKVMDRRDIVDTVALAQEVSILRSLSHRQVVRFLDFYEEPTAFYIILEKVAGGELFDRIFSVGRFAEADARAFVRSLLEALAYCHSQKVAHRDVKPENILMASQDIKDCTIKLADFGLARSVADGPVCGPPCGTPSYMAPEALKLEPHGPPIDCWGAGVVTHILLGGYPPFYSPRQEKLFRLIKSGRVSFYEPCWGAVSIGAKDFIVALLNVKPEARLTAEQALQHPWIQEANDDSVESGDGLYISLTKLRVFNAKRKFRAVIQTLIACQQLHSLASFMTGMTRPSERAADDGSRGGGERDCAKVADNVSSPASKVQLSASSENHDTTSLPPSRSNVAHPKGVKFSAGGENSLESTPASTEGATTTGTVSPQRPSLQRRGTPAPNRLAGDGEELSRTATSEGGDRPTLSDEASLMLEPDAVECLQDRHTPVEAARTPSAGTLVIGDPGETTGCAAQITRSPSMVNVMESATGDDRGGVLESGTGLPVLPTGAEKGQEKRQRESGKDVDEAVR